MPRPEDLDPYASTDEWKFKNRTAEKFARYAKELEARIEKAIAEMAKLENGRIEDHLVPILRGEDSE